MPLGVVASLLAMIAPLQRLRFPALIFALHRISQSDATECGLCPRQGSFRRSGSVDPRPVKGAKVIVLLRLRHARIGIGGIVHAGADAARAGSRRRR